MKQYILPIITLSIIGNNTTIAFEELKDLHEQDAIHEIMQQQYALHQAIKANNDYLVTRLLNKRHYNVNEKDNDGNTPLHLAIDRKNIAIVELLLKHRADPNIQNNDGLTALHSAVLRSTPEIVRLLLEHKKTNPNIPDRHGDTALHRAVLRSTPEIIKLLLQHNKTNPNIPDRHGDTALHRAVFRNTPEIVRLLLEHKTTNPNIQNNNGFTALHYAVFSSNPNIEIIRLLLQHKAINPNIPDRYGRTALHYAVNSSNPNIEIIRLLLEHNADPGIKDKIGITPLDYTIERKHKEIQNLIEEHIKQYKIKRNEIIGNSLSSHLPDGAIELISEYDKDENPSEQRLLNAINTNNIDQVKLELLNGAKVTADTIRTVKNRIIQLTTSGAAQSSTDISNNARDILELLLHQQLLDAINTGNITEVKKVLLNLSEVSEVPENIIQAAQDRMARLTTPGTAQSRNDISNAREILELLLHQQLLYAINTGNVTKIKKVLVNIAEIPEHIIKAAQDRMARLTTSGTALADIGNAREIIKLLLDHQLLHAVNTGNIDKVQKALSDGAKVTEDIQAIAQDRIDEAASPNANTILHILQQHTPK